MPTTTEIGWAADATRLRHGFGPGCIDPNDAIRRTDAYLLRMPLGTTSESIDGAFMRKDGRCFVVINTQTFSLTRQRFSAAHELGHLVLHGDRDQLIVDVDLTDSEDLQGSEAEADFFAGAFLMDEASVKAAVKDCTTAEHMAMTVRFVFVVSVPAATRRLVQLGLITEDDSQAIRRRRRPDLAARHKAAGVPPIEDRVGPQTDIDPKLLNRVEDLFVREIITKADRRKLTALA